ncbi:MAG: hypothetical protein KC425_16500, partial [Anaerolineales bacterium]|nr:hypothetical protein [Anaerolineales bacterium]
DVPAPLLEQLAVNGRLVMPVGQQPRMQRLWRVRRLADGAFRYETLERVRFVPLVGAGGWQAEELAEEQ